jgi:hypothetical protein
MLLRSSVAPNAGSGARGVPRDRCQPFAPFYNFGAKLHGVSSKRKGKGRELAGPQGGTEERRFWAAPELIAPLLLTFEGRMRARGLQLGKSRVRRVNIHRT